MFQNSTKFTVIEKSKKQKIYQNPCKFSILVKNCLCKHF